MTTKSRGMQVLHDPCLNKGTGHSINERERMGLRGLLPPKISSLDEQIERNMERFLDPKQEQHQDDGREQGSLHHWHH